MNKQMTVRATRAVVARQADNEKTNNEWTNKRRCEPHGQMNEWRTMNEQWTNKRRTMNEA